MRHQQDVSAGVIVFHEGAEGRRYLLLLSRLTKRPLWEFPKGGVDAGETLLQTALRELEEESGLRPEDIRLIDGFQASERYRFTTGRSDRRHLIHKEVTYFLAEAFREDVRLSEAETIEYGWYDLATATKRIRYAARRRILAAANDAADAWKDAANEKGAAGENPAAP